MAEQKSSSKPVESATAAPGEQRAGTRPAPLAKASESGDPAVQKLLADRYTAQQNSDKDGEKQADAALRELGFE